MATDVYKLLREADWDSISVELVAYAAFLAANLSWRTGDSPDPEARPSPDQLARNLNIAMGLNPVDIAQEAIKRVLDGRRKWDPSRGPLMPYLKAVVDSLVSHLAESKDNQLQRRVPQGDEEQEELWDRSEFRAPLNDPNNLRASQGAQPPAPDEALVEQQADRRIAGLFEAIRDNPTLEELVEAIMEVGPKPADIADYLHVTVSEVNNRLKRLRRLALKRASRDDSRQRE